jgi:hypothetical protein
LLSTDQTKGMTGLAGGLANFGLAYARGDLGDRLNLQGKDLAQRRALPTRQREMQRAMEKRTAANATRNRRVIIRATGRAQQLGGGATDADDVHTRRSRPTGGMVPQPPSYHEAGRHAASADDSVPVGKIRITVRPIFHLPPVLRPPASRKQQNCRPSRRRSNLLAKQNLLKTRRHEDRLRDNAREDKRLEETIPQPDQQERSPRSKAQQARLQAESMQIRRECAAQAAEPGRGRSRIRRSKVVRQTRSTRTS